MRWHHRLRLRLRSLLRRQRVEAELDREMRFHLDQLTAEHLESGMSAEDARLAARRAIGNMTHLAEQCRDARGMSLVDDTRRDLLYALRALRVNPGFTAVAVLTLALGIGATTTTFSVVSAVLLAPLPYPNAARLVQIVEDVPAGESLSGRPMRMSSMNVAEFDWWRQNARSFANMAVSVGETRTMRTHEGTERLDGARVSPALFAMRNVPPIAGRWLYPDEERPDARVIVLGEAAWQQYFARDPAVVDSTVALDGEVYTVVGVMPRVFGDEAFWIPYVVEPPRMGTVLVVGVTGLLRDDVPLEAAAVEVRTLGARLRDTDGGADIEAGDGARRPPRFDLVRVMDRESAVVRPVLRMLAGAVAVVLLIACANVANLLLVRGTRRHGELAIRRALGAGRGRLVRQLLAECAVLAGAGALGGVALAYAGVAIVRSGGTIEVPSVFRGALGPLGTTILPRADEVGVDATALAFAFGLSLLTAVLFGLVPAVTLTSASAASPLVDADTGRRASRSPFGRLAARLRPDWRPASLAVAAGDAAGGHHHAGRALAIAQLALATTLLVVSALLMRSFLKLSSVHLGFDPGTQIFHLVSPGEMSRQRKMEVANAARERLRALPGVEEAGFINLAPLTTVRMLENLYLPAALEDLRTSLGDEDRTLVRGISPGYLRAMGVRLIEGRWLDERDGADGPRVMLVNRAWADRFSPHASPVGSIVAFVTTGRVKRRIEWQVAGVVENMRWRMNDGADGHPRSELPMMGFMTLHQLVAASSSSADAAPERPSIELDMLIGEPRGVGFAIRTSGEPLAAAVLRSAVRDVDSRLAVDGVTTMGAVFSGIIGRERFYAVVIGVFGVMATIIAAIGIYGVLAYAMSQRTREFGVRLALGARPRQLLGLVLHQGAALVAVGVACGVAGAAGLSRYLSGMLFGVTPLDLDTYAGVAVLFTLIALLASYVPARRATKIDPLIALRSE